jgi:type II secretory ATPase GspE/PulE/Tfp pilus assembly ATPase PilB-like protein
MGNRQSAMNRVGPMKNIMMSPARRKPKQATWTRLALVLFCILVPVAAAWGAEAFPRGPGLYYSPFKLLLLIASFLGWVALCGWVDRDARAQQLNSLTWNALLLGAGLLGLLVMWNLTAFGFTWLLFWVLVLAALYGYVHYRDQRAHPNDKLLTRENMEFLLQQYLHINLTPKEGKGRKGSGVPVRIVKRSGMKGDGGGTAKVQHSKGYKSALEMIYEAVQRRATDIHLEPSADEMTLRFRIDGIMTNVAPFTRATGDTVVNIFKILCNLDITEKRKPQDGSFSAQVEARMVEFRVATAGSVQGEKLVMRLLDYSQALVDLSNVGMSEALREQVHDLVTRPHGLFLVCGPTGSGKSTTLYACLHEIDRFQLNVITVENPVEYRLDNITQIEINPKAGKTFASELRSILRQDPDVIMVGEIRDKETAEIACQAAQTGHLVLSTVHANDTLTALARLIDLGVAPYQVASALNAVLGQRLVRRLCPKCRERFKPNADTLKRLHAAPDQVRFLYRPKEVEADGEDGEDVCEECGGMGYFKRTGIFELFVMTDKIKEMMRENPNMAEIKKEAIRNGLTSLFDYGSQLVIDGQTSLPELLRVSK